MMNTYEIIFHDMEHFYQKVDSENWFNYDDLYSYVVRKFPSGSHFVEVGTWKGMSACYMAVEIINSEKTIQFDCVDTWEYVETSTEIEKSQFCNLFNIFCKNIEPVKSRINIVRSISWDAAKLYTDSSLDFVFIDAGHDHNSVTKDLVAWYPKIKSGGIIAGHDYHHDCGVSKAVNDFFATKLEPVKTMRSCWLVDICNTPSV